MGFASKASKEVTKSDDKMPEFSGLATLPHVPVDQDVVMS